MEFNHVHLHSFILTFFYYHLFLVLFLKPCPFVSLLAFLILPCVFPFITAPVHFLPSSFTSPVPDPLVSVPVYIVFVLLRVFVGLFLNVLRDVSLLLGLGLPLSCCYSTFCSSVPQVSPHVSPWYVSGSSCSSLIWTLSLLHFVKLFATFVLLTYFWLFCFPWSFGFVCSSAFVNKARLLFSHFLPPCVYIWVLVKFSPNSNPNCT